MSGIFSSEEFQDISGILPVYECAQKLFITKILEMLDSVKYYRENSPIDHIRERIKTPESIANKLKRLNLEITAVNARNCLTDIAGIRIICSYAKDIYQLVDLLKSIPDAHVLTEKDYISHPKESGYRSYHLIMEITVLFSGKTETIPVEIQLRTAAMDFWASLEHKVRYKYSEHIPKHLSDELVICADKIAELDNRMFLIHDIISLINQDN